MSASEDRATIVRLQGDLKRSLVRQIDAEGRVQELLGKLDEVRLERDTLQKRVGRLESELAKRLGS